MRKLPGILWNSFRMALQELKVNKLRTFLSLFGITIGIFCIISVLATVGSLENKIQDDVQSLGSNSIYIDKWEYLNDSNYPWWKFVNRPVPKYNEVAFIKAKSTLAEYTSYVNSITTKVLYNDNELSNTPIYGVSEDFNKIQKIEIAYGRYMTDAEFLRGTPSIVIGFENAELLFGEAARAVGKEISVDKKKLRIAGVIAKQGQSLGGSPYDYDHCLIYSYRLFASCYNANATYLDPYIIVKAKSDVPSTALSDELRGVMRQLRKLKPKEEDNFALNDINMFSEQVSGFFGTVNIGGWAIAGLSLIVGAFGVANIMFVTVRERTSQIGLKKAVGAKSNIILTEFLLESAFLCILGGVFGLLLVWVLTIIASAIFPFAITIAPGIVVLAFTICIVLGVLAGIIPASIAARMNPVEAIRSK
ncbi:ABC transporter permease [Filimonas effusa]|nr:ABC transporter permease [Filimonas effusa]